MKSCIRVFQMTRVVDALNTYRDLAITTLKVSHTRLCRKIVNTSHTLVLSVLHSKVNSFILSYKFKLQSDVKLIQDETFNYKC